MCDQPLPCLAPTHWLTSCCAEGLAPEVSPPRERKKAQTVDGRKFSWATQRIHDLEKELEQAKAKIKVCSLNLLSLVTIRCISSNILCYYCAQHFGNPVVLQHVPSYAEEHIHEYSVQMQELRTQLHKDSQEQQQLLDQQHDVIQQLQQQKQSLQVIAAMQSVALMCADTQHD